MSTGSKYARSNVLRHALGYVIAAVCLVWVFHGIHGETLARQMKAIRWEWVAAAVVFDILSYGWQGLRWRFLLHPVTRLPILRATQAVYIGLLTNEIVPLRAGELVRAYFVSRRQGVPLVSIIPSVAVERLFDGFWLAVGIALTAMFVELPADLLRAADVFGVVILAAAGLFVFFVARKSRSAEAPPQAASPERGLLRRLSSIVGVLAVGIREIGTSKYFYFSLFTSPLIFVCQIAAFWLVMKGYGLAPSPWMAAAVFIIMYFGTALPNAPSNVGTYQFFTVLGLTLFGVDKTTATGFSVAVFVILTAALWIVGLFSLVGAGMSFGDIRKDIETLFRGKKETDPTAPREKRPDA